MKLQNFLIGAGTVIGLAMIYNAIQKNRKSPPVFYKKNILKNYNARTIPPFGVFISEKEKNNNELLQHELAHWKQYQEKGLIGYYRDYSKQMKEYGYDKMPMEIEARYNESDYCKENYTECVRNGESNTVNNPKFRL